MSIISGSIPNLINGVSQQPFALRLASQAEEQINAYSSIVEGLAKRPPSKHVARLSPAVAGGSYLHIINRDPSERYAVIVAGGDLKVYNFSGVQQTVNFPHGKGYLAGSDFSMVTVADHSFVVNKSVVCAMNAEVAPSRPYEAMVFVRQGNYQTNYKLIVDETVVADYTTDKVEPATIATDHIAAQLRSQFERNGSFAVGQAGSLLHIRRHDGGRFSIRTTDGLADNAMVSIVDKAQSFASLPAKGIGGYMVEITGAPTNRFDNFYVQYDGNPAGGVWREVAKPGRRIAFDPTTMPHILVREANGTFTFKQAEWAKCRSGDEKITPEPSFIGTRISDIFFYRNRLGFIAEENVLFSKSAEFFDFWRTTATDLLDTDPIDVAVSHVKVSLLRHAIPFNETLLLFSDQTQFVLGAGEALTPGTVSIGQATEFETSPRAKPVGAGAFVYFTTNRGGFSSVREYFVDGNTRNKDAIDVTSHVPKYLKGTITKLSASTTEDILVALSADAPNEIYVYKYFYSGQEKVQSSWSRWVFPKSDRIMSCEFIESSLWIVVQRDDGLYLERIDIETGQTDGELPFNVHLDRRVTEAQTTRTYNAATKRTTITLPYSETGRLQFLVAGSGGPRPPGFLVDPARPSGTTLTVPGDYRNVPFRVGRVYEMRYLFSPFLIRDNAPGGGQIANTEGRIQLRRVLVNYADTGYFRVEVTPFRRETYRYFFTGRVLGSARSLLGRAGIETGSFKFPVMANNMGVTVEVVNDTPLPTRLLNADWEAQYTVRTRRMT